MREEGRGQEGTGGHRRGQEGTGGHRRAQEGTGGDRRGQEGTRRGQEGTGEKRHNYCVGIESKLLILRTAGRWRNRK